jgi:hypothetical protein
VESGYLISGAIQFVICEFFGTDSCPALSGYVLAASLSPLDCICCVL